MLKRDFYQACQDVGMDLPELYDKTVLMRLKEGQEIGIREHDWCPFSMLTQDFMTEHGFTWVHQHSRRGKVVKGHWRGIRKIAKIEAFLKLNILAQKAA